MGDDRDAGDAAVRQGSRPGLEGPAQGTPVVRIGTMRKGCAMSAAFSISAPVS